MSQSPYQTPSVTGETLPPQPLPYASGASELIAPTAANVGRLNDAVEYRLHARLVRSSGIHDIIMGAIGLIGTVLFLLVMIGGGIAGRPPLFYIIVGGIAAYCILLLGVGIWQVVAPGPLAMLADGLTSILAAILTLIWILRDAIQPEAEYHIWLIAAFVLTFVSGLARILRYPKFARAAARGIPSRAMQLRIDELLKSLKNATTESLTIVTFESINAIPPVICKANLLPEIAVCLINRQRLQFITRDELNIEPLEDRDRKKLKARITFAGKTFGGLIDPESLQRIESWRASG